MIATYVLIDENNVLDATKAFVAVSLVDILSIPMMQIPPMITHFVQVFLTFVDNQLPLSIYIPYSI